MSEWDQMFLAGGVILALTVVYTVGFLLVREKPKPKPPAGLRYNEVLNTWEPRD
jgi:hypothetical protein